MVETIFHCVNGFFCLLPGNAEPFEFGVYPAGYGFGFVQVEERMQEQDAVIADIVHVVFNRVRVRGDDWAVETVVRAFVLLGLIGDGGIENGLYPLL